MAMATLSVSDDFNIWLTKKLTDLNTDDEIFSPYILGILESDDSEEEKREALEGILSEITESDISDVCGEIINKWSKAAEQNSKDAEKTVEKIDVEEKLAKLLEESKVQSIQVTTKISKEKQELKDAILAQYAEVSEGDDEEEVSETPSAGLVKNINAEVVARAEREKREKDKEESHKKKEKDKEDRAKQKSKDEERKEKEKKRTQKGERRR